MGKYTMEEIVSQTKSWDAVVQNIPKIKSAFESCRHSYSKNSDFIFTGCGTSFYLALSAAKVYANIVGVKAMALPASEVLFSTESIFQKNSDGYTCVLISRSGTTTEVIRTAEKIKNQFSTAVLCALSCRPDSKLVRMCNHTFVIPEADERSVVMTRSFTSMLLMVQVLASLHSNNDLYGETLKSLPEKGEMILNKYHPFVKNIIEKEEISKFVYLGQGPFYGLACESMLKIKEMSLASSEAYYTLEFRHGPMSAADEHMLITFFISDKGCNEETVLLKEMKKLGAKTLVICEHATDDIKEAADYLVELNSGLSDFSRLILYMPITQLLGFYAAKAKGFDPDNPRNLTQVVELHENVA